MLFIFEGDLTPTDAGRELSVLWQLLKREGITRLTGVQVSFLGWNDEGRFQILDRDDRIAEMSFARDPAAATLKPRHIRRPGTVIRRRPDDMDFNPLAVMLGYDD